MSSQIALPSSSCVGGISPPTNQMTNKLKAPPSAAKMNLLNRLRNPPRPKIQVDKEQLKKQLTPLQYKVTQEKFTERSFSGEYLKLNDHGVYCCVVCGEEIFSSECKFDSGCGWPAFYSVLDDQKVLLQNDLSHVGGNLLLLALNQDLARTEVTCAKCGSHLGHVFNDGPKPTGKRYCVNSVSLQFKKENKDEEKLNCDKDKSVIDPIPKEVNEQTTVNLKRLESKSVERPRNPPPPPPSSSISTSVKQTTLQSKPVTILQESITKKTLNNAANNQLIKQSDNSQTLNEKVNKNITKLDSNNNTIINANTTKTTTLTPKKYRSVQSRYLNHLQDANKRNVIKTYVFPKTNDKALLETDL